MVIGPRRRRRLIATRLCQGDSGSNLRCDGRGRALANAVRARLRRPRRRRSVLTFGGRRGPRPVKLRPTP
jgi:hypothetical protein